MPVRAIGAIGPVGGLRISDSVELVENYYSALPEGHLGTVRGMEGDMRNCRLILKARILVHTSHYPNTQSF